MANEITNNDLLDMMKALLERTERIDKKIDALDINNKAAHEQLHQENTATQVYLETKIGPTLQLVLENQGSVSDNSQKIAAVEQRQDDLEDKVDGLGYAVKELQKKMA